jgi:PAS domain S-box-containing protein
MGVCLHLWLTGHALALDPAKDLAQYNCQTWSRQNGLLVNGVNAIAQTSDGYLWLGTSSGLIRFDGFGFTTMQPPLSGNRIVNSLASARSAGLWVGLSDNTVWLYDGENWRRPGKVPTSTSGDNRSVQGDPDGTLWMVSAKQLGRLTPQGPYEALLSITFQQDMNIMCGFRDSQGRFWFGTAEHGVCYWEAGRIHPLPAPELTGRIIFSLAEDHEGNLWVGTTSGLFCYDPGLHRKNIPLMPAGVYALLVDRQGVVWIGTDNRGLARFAGQHYDFFGKADGLASDTVKSLAEDREGSLWIGTRNGVSELTDVKFPICSSAASPQVQDAVSVYPARQGGIWIGNPVGLTHWDDQPRDYGTAAGLTNTFVKRVLEARNGDLYLICGDKQLAVWSRGKLVAQYTATNTLAGLAEDDHGVVVTVGGYLFRAGTNYFTPYAFANHLTPPVYWFLNLAAGRDGVIWAASVNGITRIKDGSFRQWTKAEGLSDPRVGWVCEDSDGVVWGAMSTGIARLKNQQIRCIGEDNGLFDSTIYAMVPDDLGNLWVDAARGIFRVSRQSLNDVADGLTNQVECYAYDGLESVKLSDKSFQEQVGCKSLDGRIWFPSANGVVVINPRQIPTNNMAPPVHLQHLRVNGREYPPRRDIVVPPGNGELELGFTALSFIAPQKIKFRYQLAGYDPDWVEAESRRLAFYTNLKPGHYTFHVIAANADGVWNRAGDAINIELRPHYYETGWFYYGCGGLLLSSLAGGYGGYVRRMKNRERDLQEVRNRLEREVSLRTRELSYERDLLRGLLDHAPDQIYFKDAKSRFIRTSKSQAVNFGVKDPGAMIGKTDFDFFTEEHARPAYEDEQQILRTGQPIISKVEKETWPDGRVSWVLTNKLPLRDQGGNIIGTLGISKDISALKRTEAELAYERDLLRALMENSPDHIYFKDAHSRFIKSSNAQARQFGIESATMLVGKSDFDFFSQEHARLAYEDEQQILRTGEPITGRVEKETWPDGRISWVLTTKMALRNRDHQIIGTFGISKDITALKQTEVELAYERDLLRTLLDSAPDSIFFKDQQSRFVIVSRSLSANLLGIARSRQAADHPDAPEETWPAHLSCPDRFQDYLIGKTDADIYGAEQSRVFRQDEEELFRTGRPIIGKLEQTQFPGGRTLWHMTTKVPWRNKNGEIIGVIGISKDISDLKHAETKIEEVHKQLLETSRLAGMAEVATNVLHNIGNVLNSVNVSATLVLDNTRKSKITWLGRAVALLEEHGADLGAFLTQDPKGRQLPAFLSQLAGQLAREQEATLNELELLRQNIEHIKEVVAMQQSYAKISGVTETIQLSELVEDALRMNIGALDRHQIQLVRDYRVLPVITVERHKILQILVNLIRNAKYACDDTGRKDKKITLHLSPLGDGVQFAIQDNGIGIPPENLTRIFDHGFTTRKGGHGFGLHSGALTARELGGSLTVESGGPGQGATFILKLPLQPHSPPETP